MNSAMKYARPEDGAAGTKALWGGRILSALAIAFFVMDGVMKLIQPQVTVTGRGAPEDIGVSRWFLLRGEWRETIIRRHSDAHSDGGIRDGRVGGRWAALAALGRGRSGSSPPPFSLGWGRPTRWRLPQYRGNIARRCLGSE